MMAGADSLLAGGGDAGARLRALDWASSPLGQPETWPVALKSAVRSVLEAQTPMMVVWGSEQVAFYNDFYAPEMGARHPGALGQPTRRWWTEMRQARDLLQRTLTNAEIIGLWDWRIPEDTVFADAKFCMLYGVDPARGAAGAPIAEFVGGVHPDDRKRLTDTINHSLRTGEPFGSEYRLLDRAGGLRHVLARGQAEFDAAGTAVALTGASIDITPQREAELARRESEERYRSLFTSIDAGFCIVDMIFEAGGPIDYVFVEVNPAFERHTGVIAPVGQRIRTIDPGAEQSRFDVYGDVARTGNSARFERYYPRSGKWFDVLAFKIGGSPDRIAILFNDVTDNKAAELKLRASETQFRTFAQAMPNHVWTAPPDGSLDWFNTRVYEYSGMGEGELDGAGWTAIVHPDDLPVVGELWAASLATGRPYETEFRLRRADGVYRWHIARAAPIRTESGEVTRWVGANTDIDDQKTAVQALADLNASLESHVDARTRELMAAEEALRQSQKMEAIGQLTGGIAHDFNNLMTGIISALSLVRRRLASGKSEDVDRFMAAASASAHRAAALTHRLLAFSRQQSLDVRAVNISELVLGMRYLLNQTLGENISLEVDLQSDLWPALTDANQLENAILNLAINARDAMPRGGQLSVALANRHLALVDTLTERDEKPGDYVEVSVSDTGEGMSPEVMAKAFEPFFTTKPIGQGTGLGLSMIYGFVRQSGGHVRIDSKVGKGTRVALFLPRTDQNVSREARTAPAAPISLGVGETVLVVEDDPTVRLMATAALQDWGYRFLQASNAQEAILILRSAEPIDLLLTDVGLPTIDGRQLAEIARQYRPDLRVLFMTGYAEKAARRGEFLGAGMDLLTKPFSLDELAAKVREIIGEIIG